MFEYDKSNKPLLDKLNILVADSSNDCALLFRLILMRAGATVTTVSKANQIDELLERQKFDVVLLDTRLPDEAAPETICRIRSKYCDISIVVVTTDISKEMRQNNFEAGCDDYLLKPIEVEKLLATIASATRDKKII